MSIFDGDIYPISDDVSQLGDLAGENAKKILVVLPKKHFEIPELKSLLEKILAAKDLDMTKDILLLQLTSKRPTSLSLLTRQVDIHTILFFGVNPIQFGIIKRIRLYEVFTAYDTTVLFSDGLDVMHRDPTNKSKGALWKVLKGL